MHSTMFQWVLFIFLAYSEAFNIQKLVQFLTNFKTTMKHQGNVPINRINNDRNIYENLTKLLPCISEFFNSGFPCFAR